MSKKSPTKKAPEPIDFEKSLDDLLNPSYTDLGEHIKCMVEKYTEIEKSGLFTQEELSEYLESLKYHRNQILNQSDWAEKFENLAIAWQKKNQMLVRLYEQGAIDEQLSAQWGERKKRIEEKFKLAENLFESFDS